MRSTSPQFLWLLLLLIPVAWRVLSTERFLDRLRFRFRMDTNGKSPWRFHGRCLLPLLALACLVTALARPNMTVLRAGDVSDNLVLAIGLDVSKSMLAEDVVLEQRSQGEVRPLSNRLNAARQLVLTLLSRMNGEKVGLFFFARNGIEVVSPTRDHGLLRYMATHTDLSDLTESGSNLLAALDTGVMMVDSQTGTPARAIVLITDGEDTENSSPALRKGIVAAARQNIPVFTVGTGQTSAVHIPIRRKGIAGIDGFYTDGDDLPLKTRLDEQSLQKIAAATGGLCFLLDRTSPARLADELTKNISAAAASRSEALPEQRLPLDLAPPCLLAALLFYCLYLLL
jgi:Ca-activated chloride channel family protein